MYEKLMEVEHAIIDLEKVLMVIDLAVSNIINNPSTEHCEKELTLLQEMFSEKYDNLKDAFYDCYEQKTA